jgi:hypothetical protein
MQLVKFLIVTIATLIVRSVLNKGHVLITAAFAAVVYYLYPAIEALYVAAAITTAINLTINAIHMAWEAYWLFAVSVKAERLYSHACKIDNQKGWSESAWTEAEEAHNDLYARMTQVPNNFLFKGQKEYIKVQTHNIDSTRRTCIQARVDAREYARKMTASYR